MDTPMPSPAILWLETHHPPSKSAISGGTTKTNLCCHCTRQPQRSANSGWRTIASPRRKREHTARLHCSTRPNTFPPHRYLHATGRRLHPPFSKNRHLELGRATCTTNEMAPGVPVPDVPRKNIPPSLGDGRPHHSRLTTSQSADKPCRDSWYRASPQGLPH